jgi:GNAT superfamily N-acetyltransferase
MAIAEAIAVFSTDRLDIVFLSPDNAAEAGKAVLGSPKFVEAEFGAPPDPDFAAELLAGLVAGEPPPGVTRSALFPFGLALKGQSGFIGTGQFVLGFPAETVIFVGLLMIAEANQRKGYGREFFTGLYDWARPQGINFVRVRLHPRHTDAAAFLDKIGYADLPNKLSSGHAVWERKLPAVED